MAPVYLIGSLKNSKIPEKANVLRERGWEVFDDWFSAGPEADKEWQNHEAVRGRPFEQAIGGFHAWEVYGFDKTHLERCDAAAIILPAGKSAHIELGYAVGIWKPAVVYMPEQPSDYDVMYRFANVVVVGEPAELAAAIEPLRIALDRRADHRDGSAMRTFLREQGPSHV